MSDRVYCTYFDSGYLSRGRVMIETLREQGDHGLVYVLVLDEAAHVEVSKWWELDVQVVTLAEIEGTYPQLLAARSGRTPIEYLFTLTPWLTHWTLSRVRPGGWATYLDADMAFYSSTAPIYELVGEDSIAIVEHRFTWEQKWRQRYGRFNVAWVGFRNDERGQACLNWWADACLEWCFDEVSDGRFADQGYLDRFPQFPGVVVLDHPGADLAPWNLRRHEVSRDSAGSVKVDGEPLIFFHFHGLREEDGRYFFKHFPYLAHTTPVIRDDVYRPYCELLGRIEVERRSDGEQGSLRPPHDRKRSFGSHMKRGVDGFLRLVAVRRGDYLDLSASP